jgi:hypothetical protein
MTHTDTLVTQVLAEIRQDIDNGTVPSAVCSFSELHDYVDANSYAGLDEMDLDEANEVSDRVNAVLVSGRGF